MAKVIVNTSLMSREEWLNWRNKGIGGSDVGIILGINKYKTAFELWLEKTGQVELQEINNEAIHFGNVLEDVVAREFSVRSGKKVRRRNQMLQHAKHEFMFANLDREIVGEKALLECKTASAYLAKEWEGDEIPASYLVQVNHYLAVTGYEKAYIAALIGGNKFVWKEINRDEELINIIIQAEKDFWENNVLGGQAPAIDGSNAAEKYIKERFDRAEEGKTIVLPSEVELNIQKLSIAKKAAEEFNTEVKRIENEIKMALADAEIGTVGSYKVTWKNVTSNRIDSKLLKEKHPDIAAEVTKASSSRRFEIKEAKE